MTKNIINIGLPSKGRLEHDTINIFKKNRLNIYSERGERDLFGYIKKLSNVKIIYLHARECIEQLSLGNIDIGFSGYDLFKESEGNIHSARMTPSTKKTRRRHPSQNKIGLGTHLQTIIATPTSLANPHKFMTFIN